MTTYRAGNHWGVTIVREPAQSRECDGHCSGNWTDPDCSWHGTPKHREGAELVAVVVNGDQALAERICALLNADDRCWHGMDCPGSGPECERDAPLKGGHRDCAAAWHAEHGCCTEPYDLNAPSRPLSAPVNDLQVPLVPASTPSAVKPAGEQLSGGRWYCPDHPGPLDDARDHVCRLRPAPPSLGPGCICNDPPPTVDKPKNGTASRPPGWACPRHGMVI